jgi:hypothetical protein
MSLDIDRKNAIRVFTRAMRFGAYDLSTKLEFDDCQSRAMAEKFYERTGIDNEYEEDEKVDQVAIAMEVLGLSATSLDDEDVDRLETEWEEICDMEGGRTQVRIRKDLMFDFRDSWDFRESAILCGVYAGIGQADFQCLTHERIFALAMGFSSMSEMTSLVGIETPPPLRLVQYSLKKLEKRNLFQRASPNRRHYYYSNKCSEDQLLDLVVKKESSRLRRTATEKQQEIVDRLGRLIDGPLQIQQSKVNERSKAYRKAIG